MKIHSIIRAFHRKLWIGRVFKPPVTVKIKISEKCPNWCASDYLHKNFHSVSNFFHENNTQDDTWNTIHADINRVNELSDDELQRVISLLRDFYSTNRKQFTEHNWIRLLRAIDNECVRRSSKWDLNTNLNMLNKFYPFAKKMCMDFMFVLVKKKFQKAMKSPIPIMMKYLSIIDYYNFWGKYYMNWYDIQHTLVNNIDNFTTDEISNLLNALSRLNAAIVDEDLLINLLNRLMIDLEVVNLSTLCKFLVFFSFQLSRHRNIPMTKINPLLNFLEPKLLEYDIGITRYVALICVRNQIYHPGLLNTVAKKVMKETSTVKAAQLNDILNFLVYFNYNSDDIYTKIISNFNEEPLRTNLATHPKRLVKILGLLTLVGIYPYEYVTMVLSPEFLHRTFGKKLVPENVLREIMIINEGVSLECPDYNGNKLNDALRQKLLAYWSSYVHSSLAPVNEVQNPPNEVIHKRNIRKPSSYNLTLLEIRSSLTSLLGGPEFIHTCYVLPFLPRPNLLFALDKKNTPAELPAHVVDTIRIDINSLDKNLSWYVVLLAMEHPNEKDVIFIQGKDVAKVRILTKLGFKLISVVKGVWIEMSGEQRLDYLKQFLN